MASSISSSDHRLPMSKRRLKPLILRDYLLDDLSSCSSNGFKSFPRHQSSTVRRLLDAEIKRSGIFHHKRRLTCGSAFSHAVQKASMAILSAVKLLPFSSSSVNSPSPSRKRDSKKGLFSRRFSRNLWKKLSLSELNNVERETERKMEDREQEEIKRWRSFADFLQESQDQPSDRISCISPPKDSSFSGEATLSNAAVGDSSSFGSEFFTNSEVAQSSGESETSNENDAVGDVTEETTNGVVVMMSGDCVGSHVSDGSSVNDNREECVNEEKEQFSPISILECSFEDDAITPHSHQNETDEKNLLRKSKRFESLVRLEPVDLEKRIEQYVGRQHYDSHHMVETEEDQSENRANRLVALVKSRLIEEPSHWLASQKVDNLLLDFFKEDGHNETRDEDKLVKIVEEWVMRRQEEKYYMFMSWEVREKRTIYVKEMKWGCINGDEREYVVDELGNVFLTSLIDELILDLSL